MRIGVGVAMIQTWMKYVGMEMDTLPRHVQGSRTIDGCRKLPKIPRKGVVEHKKVKGLVFQCQKRHDRGLG